MSGGPLYPEDEQAAIMAELQQQLGAARNSLSKAAGLAKGLDYKVLGFDSRKALVKAIEKMVTETDRGIDALNGNKLDQGLLAFAQIQPFLNLIAKIGSKIITGGH